MSGLSSQVVYCIELGWSNTAIHAYTGVSVARIEKIRKEVSKRNESLDSL